MRKKRILVTGCAGSIGSEIVRQLSKNNDIFGIDTNESGLFSIQNECGMYGRVGDIRNKETVHDIFSDFKPQMVFHAAAYKHVPLMEKYPEEAIQTNIIGTSNIVSESKKWECLEKFVYISTDKVVNAHCIMGISKKFGEVLTVNQGKGFVAVRFGNVMGSRGSLLPIWEEQINKGRPITITDDRMERYFMTIEEAVSLVIKAADDGIGGEVYILDMGKPIRIIDLAKKIVSHLGRDVPIENIGIREGETLGERLMTEEEEKRAIKKGQFYIIK
jgi:FlaA1/EpsC-like NDP-sugar epimerase